MRLFVDGLQVARRSVSGTIVNASNDAFIGGQPFSPAPFNFLSRAAIDDVFLASQALSASEIAQVYSSKAVGVLGNLVQGNSIGTDASGTLQLGNGQRGISVIDSANNTIGGTASGTLNVISSNFGSGIVIAGPAATGNSLRRNLVYGNNSDVDQ